jgi:lipopolysaccharide biosynthesis glycosyltransferase
MDILFLDTEKEFFLIYNAQTGSEARPLPFQCIPVVIHWQMQQKGWKVKTVTHAHEIFFFRKWKL